MNTTTAKWVRLTDHERFALVQSCQRLSNALGSIDTTLPERRLTTAAEWVALNETQKRGLLSDEEHERNNRAALHRTCTCRSTVAA